MAAHSFALWSRKSGCFAFLPKGKDGAGHWVVDIVHNPLLIVCTCLSSFGFKEKVRSSEGCFQSDKGIGAESKKAAAVGEGKYVTLNMGSSCRRMNVGACRLLLTWVPTGHSRQVLID